MVTKRRLRFHDEAPQPGGRDPLQQILARLDSLEQAVALLAQGGTPADPAGDGVNVMQQEATRAATARQTRDRRIVRERETAATIAAINAKNRERYGLKAP